MTILTTHQRELLQAVLDGKELVGVVSDTPHNSQDLLHAIARQPTSLKIKPEDKVCEEGKMNTLDKLQSKLAGSVSTVGSYKRKDIADNVECADGTTISVQASRFHYSTPRSDCGPYTHVEVWQATAPVTEFDYDEEYPSAYVPIEKVIEFIDNHGGFKP